MYLSELNVRIALRVGERLRESGGITEVALWVRGPGLPPDMVSFKRDQHGKVLWAFSDAPDSFVTWHSLDEPREWTMARVYAALPPNLPFGSAILVVEFCLLVREKVEL